MSALPLLAPAPARNPRGALEGNGGVQLRTARTSSALRSLIYARAGISLHAGKQANGFSRLSRRLRETGPPSSARTCSGSKPPPAPTASANGRSSWNCLTPPDLLLFREAHPFRGAARRSESARHQRPAHLVQRSVHRRGALHDRHDGGGGAGPRPRRGRLSRSDMTPRWLAPPRAASTPSTPAACRPSGCAAIVCAARAPTAGSCASKPELSKMIEFRSQNLNDARLVAGRAFDIVFCRNR